MTELWEANHPYYAMEGNFYKKGQHYLAASWVEFMERMGDSDHDLDLLYRWDWVTSDPDDYDAAIEEVPAPGILLLFFIGQRKARAWSYSVEVGPDDAPAVRAWLTERAKTMAAIWAPISLAPTEEPTT